MIYINICNIILTFNRISSLFIIGISALTILNAVVKNEDALFTDRDLGDDVTYEVIIVIVLNVHY